MTAVPPSLLAEDRAYRPGGRLLESGDIIIPYERLTDAMKITENRPLAWAVLAVVVVLTLVIGGGKIGRAHV